MSTSLPTVPLDPARFVSASQVLAAIAAVRDLPACAPAVVRALSCLEHSDFSVHDLKEALLSDPAIAARVLRLANSAYFGFRSEVQTVSQAVVLMGQARIRTLLHRILADRLLLQLGFTRYSEVRQMSLATATASCLLSQLLARDDAEEMLLAGLLHNIGELFYLAKFPAYHEQVRERKAGADAFGVSCWQAGRLLLEAWNFPRLFPTVAQFCEDPLASACPLEYRLPVWLVHAGRRLAQVHLTGRPAQCALEIPPVVREACHLDDQMTREILDSLPRRLSLEQLQAARA